MTQSEEGSRYEGVGGIGVNVGGEGMTSDGDVEDKGYDDDEEEEGHEDDHDKSLQKERICCWVLCGALKEDEKIEKRENK